MTQFYNAQVNLDAITHFRICIHWWKTIPPLPPLNIPNNTIEAAKFHIFIQYAVRISLWLSSGCRFIFMLTILAFYISKICQHSIDGIIVLSSYVKLADCIIRIEHHLECMKQLSGVVLIYSRPWVWALRTSKWCLSWSLWFMVHLLRVNIP